MNNTRNQNDKNDGNETIQFTDSELPPQRLLPSTASSSETTRAATLSDNDDNDENVANCSVELVRVIDLFRKLKKTSRTKNSSHGDDFIIIAHQKQFLQETLHRIQLGKCGNCYFISAVISILNSFLLHQNQPSSTTNLIETFLSNFFILEECDAECGKYVVSFFDFNNTNSKIKITIDDFLPFDLVRKKLVYSRIELPLSAGGGDEEDRLFGLDSSSSLTMQVLSLYWVSILEKAYVKFHHLHVPKTTNSQTTTTMEKTENAYEILRRGKFPNAVQELLGGADVLFPIENLKKTIFSSTSPSSVHDHETDDSSNNKEQQQQQQKQKIVEMFWNKITVTNQQYPQQEQQVNLLKPECLLNLCTSLRHSTSSLEKEKQIRSLGLVPGHSYSVIGAYFTSVSSSSSSSNKICVLELRDPAASITKKKRLKKLQSQKQQSTNSSFFINLNDLFSARFEDILTLGHCFNKGSAWLTYSYFMKGGNGNFSCKIFGGNYFETIITRNQSGSEDFHFHPKIVWKLSLSEKSSDGMNNGEEKNVWFRLKQQNESAEQKKKSSDSSDDEEESPSNNLLPIRLSVVTARNLNDGKQPAQATSSSRKLLASSNSKFQRQQEVWITASSSSSLLKGNTQSYFVIPLCMKPSSKAIAPNGQQIEFSIIGRKDLLKRILVEEELFGEQAAQIGKATEWRRQNSLKI